MDDLRTVINSLNKSDYLAEWIIELKGNEVLFSPKRNIKPCVRVDEQHVRSDLWEGLLLLETYCKKQFDNKDVDEFIVSLINESIDLYENDTNTDPYMKLNSSNAILQGLLDIILSKAEFVDKTKFSTFIEIYLNGALSWPFSLAYSMFQSKNILIKANQDIVFNAYKILLEQKTRRDDFEKYLVVQELIEKNPYRYYDYSKSKIINDISKEHIFDMGSFFEYGKSYSHEDFVTIFEWLKISSKQIDSQLLTKDIVNFISSENDLLNKVGLCLIHLNFDNTHDLFFENIDLFFSNENFYADLRCLLSQNGKHIFSIEKRETLINALENASFGLEPGPRFDALKNHLAIIYNKNGIDVPYQKESKSAEEFVLNFNKSVYSVESRMGDDVERIKESIKDKTIEEAANEYSRLSNGSRYYSDVLFSAFSNYLFVHHEKDFYKYIEKFDYRFATSLIYYCSDDKNNVPIGPLLETISSVIDLIERDSQYINCVSAVLYAARRVLNSEKRDELKALILRLKYKWIEIEEYDAYEDVITRCINEDLFSYFDLLTQLFLLEDFNIIKNAIDFYKDKRDCKKLKSLLACFFPRLLQANEKYALSIVDYVFDNFEEERNLSYPLLAISNGYSPKLLSILEKRDDLIKYLSFSDKKSRDEMAHSVISEWFFGEYIFNNNYYEKVCIQFEHLQFDIVLSCVRAMNYWLKNRKTDSNQLTRFETYLNDFYKAESKSTLDFSEIDQLIRTVCESIILSNDFSDVAWNLLLDLFRGFRHFFSEECVDLVDKYKKTRIREITKLLDMYFESYQPYMTYEETLVKTYSLIYAEEKYKAKARMWRVNLIDKNISIRSKLPI